MKPCPYSELSMPKKEPVQNVNQAMSNVTDLPQTINNVSGVGDVETDLSGDALMSKSAMNSPGSSSGFRKATPCADSPSFPATAISKSNKSKIAGSISLPGALLTCRQSNTSFRTGLISEEITALSRS